MPRIGWIARRWRRSTRGQDLVEYALLAALIGLAGAAAAPAIQSALSTSYNSWNTQNQVIWETPDPAGS